MDDMISRQAAIEAINSHFGFNIEEEYGSAVQEVINGLPSARQKPLKYTGESICVYCRTTNCKGCMYEPTTTEEQE